MDRPLTVEQIVRNIKTAALLGLSPGAAKTAKDAAASASDYSDFFKRQFGVSDATAAAGARIRSRAAEEFPEEDMLSASLLILLKDVWAELDDVVEKDFAASGLKKPEQPVLAAAPTGSLNACSIIDSTGRASLLFDVHYHWMVSSVLFEVATLLCEEDEQSLRLRNNVDEIRDDPEFDDKTERLAHEIMKDYRIHPEMELNVRSIQGGYDSSYFWITRGLNLFLMSHEYAHFVLGHHRLRADAIEAGLSDEDLRRLHYSMEHAADDFGFHAVMKAVGDLNGDPAAFGNSMLLSVGAFCFFFLMDARENIARTLRGLSGLGDFDFEQDSGFVGNLAFVEEAESKTHPPAMVRLHRLFEKFSKYLDSEVTEQTFPMAPMVRYVFAAALDHPVTANLLFGSKKRKGLGAARFQPVLSEYHLRSF